MSAGDITKRRAKVGVQIKRGTAPKTKVEIKAAKAKKIEKGQKGL